MIRRTASLCAVLAGLGGLALVGPVAAAAALAGVVAVGLAPVARRIRVPWAGVTAAVGVGLIGAAAAGGIPPAEALASVLVYLQVHDRLTAPASPPSRRALVLAALMLVVAAGVTRSPWFAAAVVAFAASLPTALAPSAPRLGTSAAVTAACAVAAGVLFWTAPRARIDSRDAVELTGFAPEVELGALDRLLDDPTPVFRAAVRPPAEGPVYWRGVALDTFDGRRWSSGAPPVRTSLQPPATIPPRARIVEVEPRDAGVLFTAGWPLDLDAGGAPLWLDGQGGWSARVPIDRYRIVAQGDLGPGPAPYTPPESDDAALIRARQLPPGLDPRVAEFAAQVAGEGPAAEQVARLAEHLRRTYVYTRSPADAGAEDPLVTFLFDRRSGHCEYFASALAVLARARGIPARVVNGFVGGEPDPRTGWASVRRYHAHAWVEVHDRGWILVDPTPGPAAAASGPPSPSVLHRLEQLWDDRILRYDRTDQALALLSAARRAERLLPRPDPTAVPWRGLALLIGTALVGGWIGQRVVRRIARRLLDPPRPTPGGRVARHHLRAREGLVRAGWAVPPALPPVAAAEWVARRSPGDGSDALVALAWLHTAAALGHTTDDDVARARGLLARVEAAPPTPPGAFGRTGTPA